MCLTYSATQIGLYLQHAIISGQGAKASTGDESWAKESYEIATKIAYLSDGLIGTPKVGAMDCAMVAAALVLPSKRQAGLLTEV